ncbi:MAG: hypothetical protein RBJ76_09990 [Stenomitos frigidus ULC029]
MKSASKAVYCQLTAPNVPVVGTIDGDWMSHALHDRVRDRKTQS